MFLNSQDPQEMVDDRLCNKTKTNWRINFLADRSLQNEMECDVKMNLGRALDIKTVELTDEQFDIVDKVFNQMKPFTHSKTDSEDHPGKKTWTEFLSALNLDPNYEPKDFRDCLKDWDTIKQKKPNAIDRVREYREAQRLKQEREE